MLYCWKAGLIPFKGFLICKENGLVGYCVKYLDCSHEILVQSTPPMPKKVLWKQWDDVGKHLPHWQIGLVMIRGDLKDIPNEIVQPVAIPYLHF